MSSIKIKDDVGGWVTVSGTAPPPAIWTNISGSSTFDAVDGGNYSVQTSNDQGYVFCRLPPGPADGTIVRVQVVGGANWLYLQPRGTDTIDFQAAQVLARHNQALVESVRYYQGHWFRLDGNYTLNAPPILGAYQISAVAAIEQTRVVSSSPVSLNQALFFSFDLSPVNILSLP
jgi:hypothetical protein